MGDTDGEGNDAVIDATPVRSGTFEPADENPLYVVLDLLAEEFEKSAYELTPPLSDVADWDAMADLFADADRVEPVDFVRFIYRGYLIEIRGSGEVQLFRESDVSGEFDGVSVE